MSRAPGTCRIDGGGPDSEIDLRVGEVGQDVDLVPAAKLYDLAIEIEVGDQRRRVGRVVQDKGHRLRHRMHDRALERRQERRVRYDGHGAHGAAGDDKAELVDRIGRARHQDDVAGRRDRLGQVGQALLGAQRHNRLVLGIDLDAEAARVVGGQSAPQTGNAARVRVAVGAPVLHRLDQLGDDVRRRRHVGIAHAEVDDVVAGGASLRLHRVDFGEYVRGQPLDAIEL